MTEETVTDRKISVSFSRKISDGNYGIVEATAWVQGDAPESATPGDVSVLLGDLFDAAAVAVFTQLGVEYEMEEGVIREIPKAAVTPAHNMRDATEAVNRAFPNSQSAPTGSLRVMNPNDQDGPLPDWIHSATARDGVTAVWDNRRQAAGTKQPHFKEAVARGATGHGKDGTAKGYWPPR